MKKKVLVVLGMVIFLTMFIIVPEKAAGETYEYDDLNRVTKVTYDDGSYVTYEYDKNGNIVSVKIYEAATSEKEETIKKPQETTKNPQEQETTKKPQETTKKPQEQETTKKSQETAEKPKETTKKIQPPLRGEEETTIPQNVFSLSGIGNGVGTDGMANSPVFRYLPGSQAFDAIKNILESYKGVSGSAGQKNGAQKDGENRSSKGDNVISSQTKNQRERAKEYINKKFPNIMKITLKFVMGIMRVYLSLGR